MLVDSQGVLPTDYAADAAAGNPQRVCGIIRKIQTASLKPKKL